VTLLRHTGMITATGVTDEQIYRTYAAELTRYATGLVGPFDAADVVSDACLRAFRSRGWPDVTNHRAYLYRTVLRVANDHHRSTLARRIREQKAAAPSAAAPVEIDVDVLAAVERLSMRQRAAVLLTYWGDLAPDQVAEHMGISPGSVKRHLTRARRRLRGWLT
jgi:RNA polymerase sigma factor (sigma-70 family)